MNCCCTFIDLEFFINSIVEKIQLKNVNILLNMCFEVKIKDLSALFALFLNVSKNI